MWKSIAIAFSYVHLSDFILVPVMLLEVLWILLILGLILQWVFSIPDFDLPKKIWKPTLLYTPIGILYLIAVWPYVS
ncbi:MAG: hypothetical protein AAB691_03670 [Patescibacteria group bacterium]